jgi:phospholipase/lecithinase/hemolysin
MKFTLAFVAVAAATFASDASAKKYRNRDMLFVVGDSLSDNGNLKRMTGGAYPVNRRAGTEGPVWNEMWAYKNKFRLKNEAVYSATLDSDKNRGVSGQRDNWPVMGVVQQIDALHYSRKFERCLGSKKNKECVLVILGGGNDFSKEITKALTIAATTQTAPDFSVIPPAIGSYLDTAIARAIEYGVPKIVVGNAWPGVKTPLGQSYPEDVKALGAYIEPLVSKVMESVVAKYAAQVANGTDTKIVLWDIYADANNFIDTTTLDKTPCLNFGNYIELNRVEECADAGNRLWWDGVHPGKAFHVEMAKSFAKAVQPLLDGAAPSNLLNDYSTEFSMVDGAASSVSTAASSVAVALGALALALAN